MKKFLFFLALFIVLGVGVSAYSCEGVTQGDCPENFLCNYYQESPLLYGYRCERYQCDSDAIISDWVNTEFCDSDSRVQQRSWQRYSAFPECQGWIDFEQQLVSSPDCLKCEGEPIIVSQEVPVGCPVLGKAQYRQQVKVCSIVNNEKTMVAAERIITRENIFCAVPFIGSFLINPILTILALIVIIAVLIVLIVLKRRKK